MYFVYIFCDGNSRRAQEEYHLCNSHRQEPNRAVFFALHQRLRNTCAFCKVLKWAHDRLSVTVEMYVFDRLKPDPNVTSGILTRELVTEKKVVTM